MLYKQLVEFLGLAILHFDIEFLVLLGDRTTLPEMVQIQHQLDVKLPTITLSMSTFNRTLGNSLCDDCPSNRLTIIFLDYQKYDMANIRMVLDADIKDGHRIVLVRRQNTIEPRLRFSKTFWMFTMVIVEIDGKSDLQVFAGGVILNRLVSNSMLTRFSGPRAIFRSNNVNAVVFRGSFKRWPGATVPLTILTQIIAPYNILVLDMMRRKRFIASNALTLFQLLGNSLNFDVTLYFTNDCTKCYNPMHLFGYRGQAKLYDFQLKVQTSM